MPMARSASAMGLVMVTDALRRGCAAALLVLTAGAVQAADIRIINGDTPGEGLNDTTPRDPVPGNPGTTVGAQRLNALGYVADLRGSRIGSDVPILVEVTFSNLRCRSTNADLAAAGPERLVSDFPGAQPGVFYALALANAINGARIESGPDISADFNAALDAPDDCLGGADWYYGLDNNPPGDDLNFVSTATHELIHGLGFASFVNLQTGEFFMGLPSIYETFIRDLGFSTTWPSLNNNERMASAANDGNVVWDGPSITPQVSARYSDGTVGSDLQLYAPNPVEPGSSISHWEADLTPNALMEPFVDARGDVDIRNGIGLAACVLSDLGWGLINRVGCPDDDGAAIPSPDGTADGSGNANAGGGSGDMAGDDGSGGGGCTLGRGAPDPIWLALLLVAAWRLRRQSI